MERRLWTREEEIVVFNLYCKIPFSKSSKSHPEVIRIANMLGRTPSAVNMKIGNFGRFDDKLSRNGITGLKHGSKMDEVIWNEFNEKWDKLAYESEMILQALEQNGKLVRENHIYGKEVERKTKVRVNQNFFRATVLASYRSVCCVTGLSTEALLIASHIKPWHVCDDAEKTNPCNGLCLNALHDVAYDKGFMTIGLDYKIHISSNITDIFQGEIVNRYFKIYEGSSIILPEKFSPDKEFLRYHNDMIFESWKRG